MVRNYPYKGPKQYSPRECKECGEFFTPTHHKNTYCPKHRTIPGTGNLKPVAKGDRRYCQSPKCQKRIPSTRPRTVKYCSKQCQYQAAEIRRREKKRVKLEAEQRFAEPQSAAPQKREGQLYQQLKSQPEVVKLLLDGTLSPTAYAQQVGETLGAVTRAMHAIKADIEVAKLQGGWQRSRSVEAMLPWDTMLSLRTLPVDGVEFNAALDVCVRAYTVFSKRFFQLEGKRPLIKPFHQKWIRATIRAWAIGGKQMILSPPRHGKSEMLIRFVVWLIKMDYNIRIGWFCASSDVAELMIGAVKDHLEYNEPLNRATLPPGEIHNPGLRSGKAWSKKEIKIAQCERIGQKSSTLLALGLTSKFLSRDMDFIIIDDPEDFDSTAEPGQRKKARNKLAEVGTRKTEEVAIVYISSRQHPDDIPSHLLAMEGTDQSWNAIVDSAHDEGCGADPDDYGAHVDCMLFPEVRSYRWLMEKKGEMSALGIPHAYSMRYLNAPIPEEGRVYDVPLIREVALDRDRGIGLEGLPLGYLVGGLDPSSRGIQASFLWHYREDAEAHQGIRMSMVDSDAEKSGGVEGAVNIIVEWYETYGLTLWFYETNSQQIEFYDIIKKRVAQIMENAYGLNPISIKDHNTGRNKKDAELGISAMAPLYHHGSVSLPYGTTEARVKTNMLLRQLEMWTVDGVTSDKVKTDMKMASWFPYTGKIQSFIKKRKKVKLAISQESSYAGLDSMSQTPWQTQYPGGT